LVSDFPNAGHIVNLTQQSRLGRTGNPTAENHHSFFNVNLEVGNIAPGRAEDLALDPLQDEAVIDGLGSVAVFGPHRRDFMGDSFQAPPLVAGPASERFLKVPPPSFPLIRQPGPSSSTLLGVQ
jgi:hypothetical protein